MTDINLNVFGSLTTSAGKKLDFKDFDTNNDGIITAEEYDAVVKEQQLDTVSFATVNTNTNDDITATEFETWQTKLSLQDELKKLLEDHKADFDQYPSCYTDVAIGLRKFMQSYDLTTIPKENIIEDFKTKLEAEYKNLYESAYNNSPEVIADKKGASIDNVIERILEEQATTFQLNDEEKEIFFQKLGDILSGYAEVYPEEFVVGKETEWETALKENLYKRLDGADKGFIITEELDSKFKTFQDIYDSLGNYVTKSEMAKLKLAAIEVVKNILKQGGLVQLNGKNMTSESIITSTIENDFASADKLYEAIIALKPKSAENTEGGSDTLIASLVKETKDAIIDKIYKEEQEELAKLEAIKGYDLAINLTYGDFDFSTIDGYNTEKTIKFEEKSRRKLNPHQALINAKEKAKETLEQLRETYKNKMMQICDEKGLDFSVIEKMFNKAFDNAITETLNGYVNETQVGTQRATIWSWGDNSINRSSKAEYNVKELVDGFMANFNTKMAEIYDTKKESKTDLDLEDIGYNLDGLDPEVQEALVTGKGLVWKGRASGLRGDAETGIATEQAEKLVEALKETIKEHAIAMCQANGIEFNETDFNNLYNSVSEIAIDKSVVEHNIGDGKGDKGKFKELSGQKLLGKNMSVFNPSVCYNTVLQEFETKFNEWAEAKKAKI